MARYQAIEAKLDHGLNGGSVVASNGGSLLSLTRDQLVPGVFVSGTVSLAPSPIADDGQSAVASLTVHAAGIRTLTLTAAWTTGGADARAEVAGSLGKLSLAGTMPAP